MDAILKLVDISLTGFAIFVIWRLLRLFIPKFLDSQQKQAKAMGDMAASVGSVKDVAGALHDSADSMRQHAESIETSAVAMTKFADGLQEMLEQNREDHTKILICVRTMMDDLGSQDVKQDQILMELNALPCRKKGNYEKTCPI